MTFLGYLGDNDDFKTDMGKVSTAIQAEMNYLRATSSLPLKMLHLSNWRTNIAATMNGTIRVWFNADPGEEPA